MQTRNRLLDDLARLANGAAGTVTGLRAEIEDIARQRLERILAELDLVPREEFEAVKAMAAKARSEQEALEKRIADLEAQRGGATARAAKPTRKSPDKSTGKAAPKATGTPDKAEPQ